ncbi:putative tricarboxylic transport membrane protein [Stackebrandtia albiflava]|uniref:Putative tricarboxylic transport membrane protein n=1 Tax=Stackebrandtia albiflava TaxID=406432 RepID=A0A562V495_9ACTN|nr:tripartite tricarboxylate transporter substrate-binding protein [Stackebrandtia albiflava]TWJ12652.1 putative tricarboxylic transport membrane protein [Stackebrandtia albiflava]
MRRSLLVVLVTLLGLTACAGGVRPPADLRILVPNLPGSGYDVTARVAAEAAGEAGLYPDLEVFNLPGGGGNVGLQRMGLEAGNPGLLMLMGLGVLGGQHSADSPTTLADTTPVARLLSEPGIIVVRREAPYRSMSALVEAWRDSPSATSVGGGSAVGGPDHVATMLIAQEIGIAPPEVDYRQYDGGGDLLTAVLRGEVAFGVSGISEYPPQVWSGQLRVLAVSGAEPTPGVDAPTLRECGIDVVFTNWRGIVAPPGLTAAETEALRGLVEALRDSAPWRNALERYGWTDAYLPGDEFGDFIAAETDRLDDLLTELDLATVP